MLKLLIFLLALLSKSVFGKDFTFIFLIIIFIFMWIFSDFFGGKMVKI